MSQDSFEQIDDLQAVNFMPLDTADRAKLDNQITLRIFLAAHKQLNDADKPALQRLYRVVLNADRETGVVQVAEPPETSRRLFSAIDEGICEHARSIGMRIFLSRLVYPRICQWEDESNGAELHEKLGRALALHVRISRGEAKAPIDAHLKSVRKEFISEVKRLQRLLKANFSQHSLPDEGKIRTVASEMIAMRHHEFIHLKTNRTAILQFDAQDVCENDEALPRLSGLITGTASPAAFVDALLAWSTGRSSEALRQALTKL